MSKPIDLSRVPPTARQKGERAKQEVMAHLIQALAYTGAPQQYQFGRNSLAARFLPALQQLSAAKLSEVRQNALTILNDPAQRQAILGGELSRLDFRRDLNAQLGNRALIRPEQQTKTVQPKSGTGNTGVGKLKLQLRRVELKDETDPEGGDDEIYLGMIFVDAKEKSSKLDPFFIADFNEGVKSKEVKQYNPYRTLKTYDVDPGQNGQTFFGTFMLFEQDGTGMYSVVSVALNAIAAALAAETFGISVAIMVTVDAIVAFIAGDDAFPPVTREITLHAGAKDFQMNNWFYTAAHGGRYNVYYSWEYFAPAQASQPLTASEQQPLPVSSVYQDEDGIVYYIREIQDNFYWYGEDPKGNLSTVFAGKRKGNAVVGEWASVPKGKAKKSGQLAFQVVETIVGNILKVGRHTGDFPGVKWLPINPPANGLGKVPVGFKGGIGNLDGYWTADDGGRYYLQQVGKKLFWFGEQDVDSGKPAFANIAVGTINGDKISLNWADVSKGNSNSYGILALQITNPNTMRKLIGPNFGGTLWSRDVTMVRPACLSFDPKAVLMEDAGRGVFVKTNDANINTFRETPAASQLLHLIQQNGIDQICRIGTGSQRTHFLLTNGQLLSGPAVAWEKTISFSSIRSLEVKKTRHGTVVLEAAGKFQVEFASEAEAYTVRQMINKYGATKYCTIGTGSDTYSYWRK